MPSKLQLLFVPLVLSVFLLAVSSTHAAAPNPAVVAFAYEESLEAEFEEAEYEEESECEIAAEEVEEGELGQGEADEICAQEAKESKKKASGSGATAPEECVLRSAHGHATVNDKGDELKLTVGYTAYEPANAKIKVGNLATFQRHLGRSGVLRIVKSLDKQSPKRLTVRLDVDATPGYCGKYQVEKLTVKRAGA